jgi:hypothetical protein
MKRTSILSDTCHYVSARARTSHPCGQDSLQEKGLALCLENGVWFHLQNRIEVSITLFLSGHH